MAKADKKLEPMQPEIIEEKKIDISLKKGECFIEVVDGIEKGKTFVTSIITANKYFSDESKFKIVKKNQ